MIKREIENELQNYLLQPMEHTNVLLLEGARQVGKTTLINTVLTRIRKKNIILNLEESRRSLEEIDACKDFSEFEQYLKHSFGFVGDGSTILCIDEAQESARLGGFVRFMKEKWRFTPVILTGSSMSRIFRNEERFPVGRISRMQLQPFSFLEFCRSAGKEELLSFGKPWQISDYMHKSNLELMQAYIDVGGLPAVVTSYTTDKNGPWKQLRADLFLDYKSDFSRIFSEQEAGLFAACLKGVANNLGSASLYSQMIKPTASLYKKVPGFLTLLESWKILYRLEIRSGKSSSSITPKRYLYDVGIAQELRLSALPRIDLLAETNAVSREPLGGIVENILASELTSVRQELVGWRKAVNGSEVDFLYRCTDGTLVPIECKASLKSKAHHTTGIQEYGRTHRVNTGVLINFDKPCSWNTGKGFRILSIPLYSASKLPELLENPDGFVPCR